MFDSSRDYKPMDEAGEALAFLCRVSDGRVIKGSNFDLRAVGKGHVGVDGVGVGLDWDFINLHGVDDGVDVVEKIVTMGVANRETEKVANEFARTEVVFD